MGLIGETADPIKRGSAKSAATIQTAIPMEYRDPMKRNREDEVFSILDFSP
jgi:hypothetical protein